MPTAHPFLCKKCRLLIYIYIYIYGERESERERERERVLVSLFNGISTFKSYLMPNLSL